MAWEFGVVSFFYNAGKDLLRYALGRFKKADPADVILVRQKWKTTIEDRLAKARGESRSSDAIVRDVARVDVYPDGDEREKGISSWFRIGLLGTYHRGIMAGLRVVGLKFDKEERAWRGCDYQRGEEPDLNAFVVGRIPYERIVSIDWDGDEYYGMPHIYCRFSSKAHEPYEEIVVCEERHLDQFVYYSEIAKLDDVRKLSQARGVDSGF